MCWRRNAVAENEENKETVKDSKLAGNSEVALVTEHYGGKQRRYIYDTKWKESAMDVAYA